MIEKFWQSGHFTFYSPTEITANQNGGKMLCLGRFHILLSHHAPRVHRIDCVDHCIFYDIIVHRGYYTVARRNEFYVRASITISHEHDEWAKRTTEILLLPLEHKIHIFSPPCNVLFIKWRNRFNKSKRRESWRHWTIRHSQRWHTENTPLGSRMKWRMDWSTSSLFQAFS